jgi:hypothetical protein
MPGSSVVEHRPDEEPIAAMRVDGAAAKTAHRVEDDDRAPFVAELL